MGSPSKERRGCLEEDKTSLESANGSGYMGFPLCCLPCVMYTCAPPGVGCWDFSVLCQVIYLGKLCILAEEGGEGWLRASILVIMPADTWQ